MICKYAYRQEELNNGKHYLTCDITNTQCLMIRFCSTINDIVNIDNVDKKCKLYINKENVEYMKQGEYKVLFESKGKLWIELDSNTAITIPNPFGSEIPLGVDLVKIKDEYFIKGFEPKEEIEVYIPVNDTREELVLGVESSEVESKKTYTKKETKKKEIG